MQHINRFKSISTRPPWKEKNKNDQKATKCLMFSYSNITTCVFNTFKHLWPISTTVNYLFNSYSIFKCHVWCDCTIIAYPERREYIDQSSGRFWINCSIFILCMYLYILYRTNKICFPDNIFQSCKTDRMIR